MDTDPVHPTEDLSTPSARHDSSYVGDAVYFWVASLEKTNHGVGPGGDDSGSDDQDNTWNHSNGVKGVWQGENSDSDLQVDEEKRRLDPSTIRERFTYKGAHLK